MTWESYSITSWEYIVYSSATWSWRSLFIQLNFEYITLFKGYFDLYTMSPPNESNNIYFLLSITRSLLTFRIYVSYHKLISVWYKINSRSEFDPELNFLDILFFIIDTTADSNPMFTIQIQSKSTAMTLTCENLWKDSFLVEDVSTVLVFRILETCPLLLTAVLLFYLKPQGIIYCHIL